MSPDYAEALHKAWQKAWDHCQETGHRVSMLLDVSTFGNPHTWQCFDDCDERFS